MILGYCWGSKMIYKILQDSNLEKLEKLVNEHINDGWLPIGGVSKSYYDGTWPGYLQAVIKTQNTSAPTSVVYSAGPLNKE